jgi:hypothetical protein
MQVAQYVSDSSDEEILTENNEINRKELNIGLKKMFLIILSNSRRLLKEPLIKGGTKHLLPPLQF